MTLTADPHAFAFLGNELLTWLWYRCEADGGVFALPEGDVGLVFNDYVQLVAPEGAGEGEQSIVKKGSAHRSAEAHTALRRGKLVAQARLDIARADRSYSVTIDGKTLDLRGAKYPKPEGESAEDRESDRLSHQDELGSIVEGLYGLFMAVRTSERWAREEVPAIEAWIRDRAG